MTTEETDSTHPREAYLDLLKRVLTASVYEESAWIYLDPKPPVFADTGNPLDYAKQYWEYWTLRSLRKKSIVAAQVKPFDPHVRHEGRDWPCFGYTMIGRRRLDNVHQCVVDVLDNAIEGDFLEAGAWRGGTSIFMRALLEVYGVRDRKVWVADSFQGLPKPADENDGADFSEIEILSVSLEQVKANFARFGLLDDQVAFLRGWFCDTLPNAPVEKVALLRLDGDMYSSTIDTLTSLYEKVSPGGYVIVDDYHSWESCRRAVHDFLDQRSLQPEIRTIDWAGAYWRV